MKKQIRVDQSANRLKKLKKSTLLVSIFKKIILKKFNNLKIGYIHLSEGNESYEFGNKKSELQANIKILSPEFYVFLGSGGLLGVTEAYTAGFWQADDIVTLIRIMIKNSHIMQKLDSGWAKLLKPINNYIHKKRQRIKQASENVKTFNERVFEKVSTEDLETFYKVMNAVDESIEELKHEN